MWPFLLQAFQWTFSVDDSDVVFLFVFGCFLDFLVPSLSSSRGFGSSLFGFGSSLLGFGSSFLVFSAGFVVVVVVVGGGGGGESCFEGGRAVGGVIGGAVFFSGSASCFSISGEIQV